MSEILKKWLGDRIGLILDYHLTSFADIAQDGTLIGEILLSYGVITSEDFRWLKKTYNVDEAYENYVHIKIWLNSIGVSVDNKTLRDIAHRDKTAAIRLFYHLYIVLNSKNKLTYIVEKNINEEFICLTEPKSLDRQYNACEVNEISCAPNIDETRAVLKWHKNKYLDLVKRSEVVRTEYVKYLEEKLKAREEERNEKLKAKKDGDFRTRYQPVEFKKKEIPLLEYSILRPDMTLSFNHVGDCKPDTAKVRKYVKYLKDKTRLNIMNRNAQTYVSKVLLHMIHDKIVEQEDDEFKALITTKLLRQSEYEKQVTKKLVEVRHLKRRMLENLQYRNRIIIAKKEEEFINKLFQQDSNVSAKEQRYINNKKRQLELHKRLWAKNCALKSKEAHEICKNIMFDITDLAFKKSEYCKRYGKDPSKEEWRDWTHLFLTEQPILDFIDDPSELLSVYDFSLYEPSFTFELYRQVCLDDSDFSDYNSLYALWNLENLENALIFFEEFHLEMEAGLNIVGFIVHRLLQVKYPFPELHKIPEMPMTDVRACLTGLVNHEVLPILQKCLVKKEVLVLEPQTVINYFLTAFSEETTVDYDEKLKDETKKGKKGKEKGKKKEPKGKGKKGTKLVVEPVTELVPKETQTPRIFPDEEIVLTRNGELGKYAYETLNLGLEMNEYLVTTLLIEYIKNLDAKGWVLINFPETLNEAYLLEEYISGKKFPENFKSDELDSEIIYNLEPLENRDDIFNLPPDPYCNIRKSQLLPNPQPAYPKKYESFLTSYIDLTPMPEGDVEETECFENDLKSFYDRLSVNNSFQYEVMDYKTISEIVKLVTRDESYAKAIYEELITSAEETVKDKKKKKAEAAEIEKGKGKKAGKGKKEKGGKGKGDKSSKGKGKKSEPEEPPPPPPPTAPSVEEIEVYVEPPKPGEPDWEYINLNLRKEVSVLLATTWEKVERIYLNDFKQLFFSKRLYQNKIIPYVSEISDHMKKFIERPDEKQEYLTEFQKTYNSIDSDLREDDEFKAELHFRVQEFRNKLWGMCDIRQKECETQRQKAIQENWFAINSALLTNVFIKAFQLEMDRCQHTLQLLQDYYSTMGLKIPLESKLPSWTTSQLFEIILSFDADPKAPSPFESAQITLANKLINIAETTEINPFVAFLETNNNAALSQLNSWLQACMSVIKNVEKNLDFVCKPQKEKGKKAIKSSKKKSEVKLTESDIKLSQKVEDMMREWTCAVEGEIVRTKFRLKLINEKASADISDNLSCAENLFHEIYDHIQARYIEEVDSVDNVCQIFARAIEACKPIQLRLALVGSKFCIDYNMLFYQDIPPTYPLTEDRSTELYFSMVQLDSLVKIFIDLAPNGCILQQSFFFVIQDLITDRHEVYQHRVGKLLPEYWYYLSMAQLKKVITELYGETMYVDWRDFIIWNLRLPYPTENELLDTRRQFTQMDPDKLEYVNQQQFNCVQFWFEEEFCDDHELLRMNLIKELLCKMFKVGKDNINYTGLLLYFCKDMDSVRGVSKALELALGNLVCWDTEIGIKYATLLRMQKEIEEKKKQEMLDTVKSVVETVFDRTCKAFESSTSFLDADFNEYYGIQSEDMLSATPSRILDEYVEEEETEDAGPPNLIYFLPFSTLLKVMVAAYPWHTTVPYMDGISLQTQLKIIYDSCRNPYFDNKVFMHEILNEPRFLDLINITSKFLERMPSELVRNFVEYCTCFTSKGDPVVQL